MIDVLTAPNPNDAKYIAVFLAGGITGCHDWQKEVIQELESEDISVYNPRQEYFDVMDKNASYKQIAWEYERLERSDIFSMYFCGGDSIQPICMYELGRNIVRMQNRFPIDWQNRIVISVEDGYARVQDVIIQVELCSGIHVNTEATPQTHAQKIKKAKMKVWQTSEAGDNAPAISGGGEWIPVSEKAEPDLPEEDMSGYFLVTLHTFGDIGFELDEVEVRKMRWDRKNGWRFPSHCPKWINDALTQKVIAWRPLPLPYTEKEVTQNET